MLDLSAIRAAVAKDLEALDLLAETAYLSHMKWNLQVLSKSRSRCETMLAMADEIERLRTLLDKPEGIACPFCGEQGFDTEGLKRHFSGGMFYDGCAQAK